MEAPTLEGVVDGYQDDLGVFEGAAVPQVDGDAGGVERVAP